MSRFIRINTFYWTRNTSSIIFHNNLLFSIYINLNYANFHCAHKAVNQNISLKKKWNRIFGNILILVNSKVMKRCNKHCLWQISNACIKPSGNWGKCLISKKKLTSRQMIVNNHYQLNLSLFFKNKSISLRFFLTSCYNKINTGWMILITFADWD